MTDLPNRIGTHLWACGHQHRLWMSTLDDLCRLSMTSEQRTYAERALARHEGAAAGHAFRAAELAYDLGAREARFRCGECGAYDGSHKYWCGM